MSCQIRSELHMGCGESLRMRLAWRARNAERRMGRGSPQRPNPACRGPRPDMTLGPRCA